MNPKKGYLNLESKRGNDPRDPALIINIELLKIQYKFEVLQSKEFCD